MPKYPEEIEYSDRYYDDNYMYRHVILPKSVAKTMYRLTGCSRLMTEAEWRNLGVQQSLGWIHYCLTKPEPHILLFHRLIPIQYEDTVDTTQFPDRGDMYVYREVRITPKYVEQMQAMPHMTDEKGKFQRSLVPEECLELGISITSGGWQHFESKTIDYEFVTSRPQWALTLIFRRTHEYDEETWGVPPQFAVNVTCVDQGPTIDANGTHDVDYFELSCTDLVGNEVACVTVLATDELDSLKREIYKVTAQHPDRIQLLHPSGQFVASLSDFVFRNPRIADGDEEDNEAANDTGEDTEVVVENWKVVVYRIRVRSSPSTDAEVLATKKHGSIARGIEENGWLKLTDESGYMLIEGGGRLGLQKMSQVKMDVEEEDDQEVKAAMDADFVNKENVGLDATNAVTDEAVVSQLGG